MYPIIVGNLKKEVHQFYKFCIKNYESFFRWDNKGTTYWLKDHAKKIENQMVSFVKEYKIGKGSSWFSPCRSKSTFEWHQDGHNEESHMLLIAYPTPTEFISRPYGYKETNIFRPTKTYPIIIPKPGDVCLIHHATVHRGSKKDFKKPHLLLRVNLHEQK